MDVNQSSFYTLDQLDQLIEVPIQQVMACVNNMEICEAENYLIEYVEFKGLIKPASRGNSEAFYVEDIFQVNKEEMVSYGDLNDLTVEPICLLMELKGTKHTRNKNVENDCIYEPIIETEAKGRKYNYDEFVSVVNRLGIPLISYWPSEEVRFNYDSALINQKSNFTLREASRIAGNAPLKDQQGVFYDASLVEHYQDNLSECVKGPNQHNFHLITTELWCHSYNDDIGECSKSYDNGTYLKISANVDIDLTILSKSEFLRWCKYMNIETGLFYNQKIIDESLEAFTIELNKSEIEISRLRGLYLNHSKNPPSKEISYPSELQIAIDAYKELCFNKTKVPTNKVIEEWLKNESKNRGITHKDGSDSVKGLSNVKAERIASIIKSKQ